MKPLRSSRSLRTILASMYMHDAVILIFMQLMSLVALVFSWRLEPWAIIVIINTVCSAAIVVMAEADHRTHNTFLDVIHRFYITVIIFGLFKEIYVLVPAVNPYLFDTTLIAIDHAVFGLHPTQWLAQFTSPPLVEILQLCYSAFYFIMLSVPVELVMRRREPEYEKFVCAIGYGFFLSYVGYFMLPAVGPRFTLHDFTQLGNEMPGLWLTDHLRAWINSGESISDHAANFFATAQRDAFPSGHTEMTLITIFYSWRFHASVRGWITVIGAGLIFATVFLRYHYVVDILGGVVFFLLTITTFPLLERWWLRVQRFASSPGSPR